MKMNRNRNETILTRIKSTKNVWCVLNIKEIQHHFWSPTHFSSLFISAFSSFFLKAMPRVLMIPLLFGFTLYTYTHILPYSVQTLFLFFGFTFCLGNCFSISILRVFISIRIYCWRSGFLCTNTQSSLKAGCCFFRLLWARDSCVTSFFCRNFFFLSFFLYLVAKI